jgi:hypothetical protein
VRQFLAEGMPMATLQDIRRQQDPQLRAAVRTAHDDGRAAFDMLAQQGRITEIPHARERYQQSAADYLAGYEAKQNTLIVSPGNDERRELNTIIRELLVERGHIHQHGRRHQVLAGSKRALSDGKTATAPRRKSTRRKRAPWPSASGCNFAHPIKSATSPMANLPR